jgi:hypothetical protein
VFGLVTTIVPNKALPFAAPFTSHAMGVPVATHKEAVKVCVCPSKRETAAGDISLEFAQVIVTVAEPDLESSAVLVAVTVTDGGDGGTAGAV